MAWPLIRLAQMRKLKTVPRVAIVATLGWVVLIAEACGLHEGGSPFGEDGGILVLDAASEAADVGTDVMTNQDAGPDVADASPPFTPAVLPGLELWLKADEGLVADGGSVLEWDDQSARNDPSRNASLGTFGAPTVIDAGFGPGIFFGVNDGLRTGAWDGGLSDPISVFVVAGKAPTTPVGNAYLFNSLDPLVQHAVFVQNDNLLLEYAGANGPSATSVLSEPMAIVAVFNGASSFILQSSNHGDAGSSSPGPNKPTAGFIIGNYAANGFGFRGYIAEFVVYSRVLSDGEIASLNAYATRHYKIAIQ